MKLRNYDLDTYLIPLWRGKVVYHETVLFVGEEDEAPLLYFPTKIVQVVSYGLNCVYQNGVDYTIQDGKIKRLKGSRIPYLEKDVYYSKTPGAISIPIDPKKRSFPEPRYAMFGEMDTFTAYQIAVTYCHEEEDIFKGAIPTRSQTMERVSDVLSSRPTKVLFYGDSIMTGCNSSGTAQGGNVAPRADSFPVMVVKKLEEVLNAQITYVNTAVGGWNTRQGIEDMESRVIRENPDLLILAFGMNDGGLSADGYKQQILQIVNRVQENNPNCYVLLVSPMLPNPETTWFANQDEYAAPLAEIAVENDRTALADVTALYRKILTRKRYGDITANNVNHPNDFIARLYAQVILTTIVGESVLMGEEET